MFSRFVRSTLVAVTIVLLHAAAGSIPALAQWSQEAKLTPNDAHWGQEFGYSVSLSGDRALVGADMDDDTGTAYVFRWTGTSWVQEAKLLPGDGEGGSFGCSVSLDGDTAVVGAFWNSHAGVRSGAAYVFRRSGTSWTQEARLTADDAQAWQNFGLSVSVSGDRVIAGAYGDNHAGDFSGAAYVFRRSGGTWLQEQKLVASDGAAEDLFGLSVSISGDYTVVGAPGDVQAGLQSGSAYVFRRSGTAWTQQARLVPNDAALYDNVGSSVCLDGDTAVVGAPGRDDSGTDGGAAYVYRRSDTSWSQQAKLLGSNVAPGDRFGASVSISADLVAMGTELNEMVNPDSAYIFRRTGASWAQEAELTSPNPGVDDEFGCSVAVDGGRALIGASYDDQAGYASGAAYVFIGPLINDLSIANVRLVQVVDDADAPLIANRPTVFLTTVHSTFGGPVHAKFRVRYNYGVLSPVLAPSDSPTGWVIEPGTNEIVVYKPRPGWLYWGYGYDDQVEIEIDPLDQIAETNELNNCYEMEANFISGTFEYGQLEVRYYPVHSPGGHFSDPTEVDLTRQMNHRFMESTYPLYVPGIESSSGGTFDASGDPGQATMNWDMFWLGLRGWWEGVDRAVGIVSSGYWTYHGVSWVGLAPSACELITGTLITDGYWTVAAHEVGHTFCQRIGEGQEEYQTNPPGNPASGMWYPPNLDTWDQWGWVPQRVGDGVCFMGYAPGLHAFTYANGTPLLICEECYIDLRAHFGSYRAGSRQPGQRVLYVWGDVDAADNVVIRNAYVLEDRPVLYPVSGQYNVEIVGADEVVLLTVPFDPVSVLLGDPEGAVDSGIGFFAMAVPEPDGDRDPMAQIRVVKEGTVLAQKDVTPNSPTVGVLWPNGGEELSVGTICTVTWQGADADGDPLYYAVLYSPDDEENWFTIAQEIQETQCTWETTGLCPGEAYRMRVIVTDGVNTTVDDSDGTFTILGTGDLDSDGDVDYYDFQVFVATWGRCLGDADYNPKADLDCDECITIVDYQMLLEYYRQFIGDPDAPPPGPPIQPVKGELVRPVEGPEARPNP